MNYLAFSILLVIWFSFPVNAVFVQELCLDLALDCNEFLADNSLSEEDKQELAKTLLFDEDNRPDYDKVLEWNKRIVFSSPPPQTEFDSNGIIKDAWLKLLGIVPSVHDFSQGKVFADENAELLAAFNYRAELPETIAKGDCNTVYSFTVLKEELDFFLNGSKLDPSKRNFSDFNAEKLLFEARLLIGVRLKANHFKEKTFCGAECTKLCLFDSTEFSDYFLDLDENFLAWNKSFDFNLALAMNDFNQLDEVFLGLTSSAPVDLEIDFGEKRFSSKKLFFDFVDSVKDNGFLQVKRANNSIQKLSNVLALSADASDFNAFYRLGVIDAVNCFARILTDFDEMILDEECSLVKKQFPQFNGQKVFEEVQLKFGFGLQSKELTSSNSFKIDELSPNSSLGFLSLKPKQNFSVAEIPLVKRLGFSSKETRDNTALITSFISIHCLIYLLLKKLSSGIM